MSLDTTLQEFGESLGFTDLRFSQEGVMQLQFDHLGDFYIEKTENGLIMYLAQSIDRPSINHYRQALELCHYREEHPFPANPGLCEENKFLYLIKLNEEDFTLPTINQAIELLKSLHHRTKI